MTSAASDLIGSLSKLGNNLLLVNLASEAPGSLCSFDSSTLFCILVWILCKSINSAVQIAPDYKQTVEFCLCWWQSAVVGLWLKLKGEISCWA